MTSSFDINSIKNFINEISTLVQVFEKNYITDTISKKLKLVSKIAKTYENLKNMPELTFNEIKNNTENEKNPEVIINKYIDIPNNHISHLNEKSNENNFYDLNYSNNYNILPNNQHINNNKDELKLCIDNIVDGSELPDIEDVNKMKDTALNLYKTNIDDKIIVNKKNSAGKSILDKIINHNTISELIDKEKRLHDTQVNTVKNTNIQNDNNIVEQSLSCSQEKIKEIYDKLVTTTNIDDFIKNI